MIYEIDPEEKKLRDEISKIFVKWDMPTIQVAISEILQLTRFSGFKAGQKDMVEKLQETMRKKRKFWEDQDHAVGGYVSIQDIDTILKELLSNQS